MRDGLDADHAAAAAAVVHHHGLAEALGQLLRDAARDGVHAAGGCERDDQAYWPGWILLCLNLRRAQCRGEQPG